MAFALKIHFGTDIIIAHGPKGVMEPSSEPSGIQIFQGSLRS